MGYLLPALTEAKFENQRSVVLNERRQNYENRPYGLAGMSIAAALYPPDHPYHWMTIGAAEDLKAATLDDVSAFFQTYYRPRNASLALAGDIDTDARARRSRRPTSAISRPGPTSPPVDLPPARLAGETPLLLEDRVELPRVYIAGTRRRSSPKTMPTSIWSPRCWPAARRRGCIAGWSTSSGSRPRWRRRRTRASSAASFRSSRPRRRAARSTISRRRSPRSCDGSSAERPTELEMERCRAQAEAHFLHRLQTVGGFGGKSDQLNAYNVFLGAPGFFDTRSRALHAGVAPTICSARRPRWLGPDRVVLSVVPRGRRDLALAGSRAGGGFVMAVDRSRLPRPGAEPPFVFPEIRRRRLANGIDAWTAEHVDVPLRQRAGADARRRRVRSGRPSGAGGAHRRSARRGLRRSRRAGAARQARAPRRAARDRSRRRRDAARPDDARAFAAESLALLAEMIAKPRFDDARLRTRPRSARSTACCSCARCRRRSPSARSCGCSTATIRTATCRSAPRTRCERWRWARRRRSTAGCTIRRARRVIAVGNASHDELADADRRRRSAAGGRRRSAQRIPDPGRAARSRPDPPPHRMVVVPRPAAPQSELRIGHVGVSRGPRRDYHALVTLNLVLGGQFVSRINTQPARAQGLHLRRAHDVRFPARARPLRRCMRACSRTRRRMPFARRSRSCRRSAATVP